MRRFAILKILTLSAIILISNLFQKDLFCEVRKPKTVVTVLEGEVSCVDYPEWLLKEIVKGEVHSGILVRMESTDIAIVDIYYEDVRAYVPDIVKKEAADKLVPDALVLLRKNIRRIKGTNWDIVAVEKRVKAGYMFREDMVKDVGLEDVINTLNVWEGMQEITYEEAAEIGIEIKKAETAARELSFIERTVLEEEEEEEFTDITFAPSQELTTTTEEKTSGYVSTSWEQVNTNGFDGLNTNDTVSVFSIFSSYIYAGTSNATGCEVWRCDVTNVTPSAWGRVADNGFEPPVDINNISVTAMTTFGIYICSGTRNAADGGEFRFSSNGSSWTKNANDGFGSANNTHLLSMASFSSSLFIGTRNSVGGCEIRHNSVVTAGGNWNNGAGSGFAEPANNVAVASLVVSGGYIYAGVENSTGAEIWRTNNPAPTQAVDWTKVQDFGTASPNNTVVPVLIEFGGYIYAGTQNNSGAEIWRSSVLNGAIWTSVGTGGFGDSNNRSIPAMAILNNYLYAGTSNNNGAQLWKSSNGTSWEQVSIGSFPSSNIAIQSMVVSGNYLYIGTYNTTLGGQVWRFSEAWVDPNITGKVYDSETGETVNGVIVSIYPKDSTTALASTTNNPYSLNVDTGYYYLRVEKEGYIFPSSKISGKTSGDHGEVFAASGTTMTIDIPMDKGYPLEITKTANKKQVVNGEIITYQIKIKNNSYWALYNVDIIDEITNGFKYIDDSTYLDSTQQDDPSISNRNATFKLASLEGHKNTYLTYQVRVGTGISPGRYKTNAVAWDSVRDWQMSNESSYTIEVIEDPLFTKGTIIGKVFYDVNGNGIQDGPLTLPSPQGGEGVRSTGEGEYGVPGVVIATEYGVCVETDSDGKYHIADVPAGQHLLKVDPNTLPEGSTFTTENPYYVKITEGLLAKVNFGVNMLASERVSELAGEKEQANPQTRKPANQFFIVALGEGEVRNIETSGNIEMVEKDDRYDEGLKVDGRLALFLKGKVLGKYLITASLDTERRPGGDYDTRKLFTNLDPDKYYPVYGDASQVDYSGVDTQDILYVLIEWDESFAKWGSFHTGIPLYERTMSGGIIEYKSLGKTKFGDDKTQLKVFGAFSRQKPAHDELIGTGGSLYYLRHRDIIEGSEKVRVEIRDRITNRTISVIYLREEIDYEIDYDTGRLLLKRPLNSITQSYAGSIIANDILAGSSVYLVIDYEYYSTEGLSNQASGIKASQWIGNHIRVGGTYIEEERPGDPYKLMGGDATIKINPKIRIDASYYRTEETLLDNGLSYDGGITFTEQGEDYSDTKSGNAVNINTTTEVFKNTDVYLEYSRQDPYYSISGSIANQGSQKYIADIIHRLTESITLGVSHITQKYLEGTIGEEIIGSTRSDTTSALIDYKKGKWDIRTEYQHREVENPVETSLETYFGTLPLLKNDFVGIRVGYELFKWLHPYIRGQLTLNGPSNEQATIGSAVRLWDRGELDLSYTKGTIGDSALIGLTTRYGEDTDIYTNIETGNNLQLGRYFKTSYGQTTTTEEGEKIYMVQDYSTYRERFVRGNLLGYDKKLNDIITMGFTYERSHINSRRLDIDRDSGSVSLSYLNEDFLKGASKLELRQDNGSTESRQWVTQNDILLRVTKGLSLSGRANWGWSEDRDSDSDLAEFYEVGAGFSLRPVTWDKINILGKYSYIMDLGPEEQTDFIQTTKALRNVYALEGIYDLCRFLSLVGKFAYRAMSEAVGPRDWVDSDTYLYIGRVNFHITKKWDIAAEYRTLANTEIEDRKSGWLLEIDRDITDYIRLGIGYNFTDYDDDLRDADNWDSKGWFVRVSGKY